MSVSEDLLCSFELLKPLDGAALKKEMTRSKRKRSVRLIPLPSANIADKQSAKPPISAKQSDRSKLLSLYTYQEHFANTIPSHMIPRSTSYISFLTFFPHTPTVQLNPGLISTRIRSFFSFSLLSDIGRYGYGEDSILTCMIFGWFIGGSVESD